MTCIPNQQEAVVAHVRRQTEVEILERLGEDAQVDTAFNVVAAKDLGKVGRDVALLIRSVNKGDPLKRRYTGLFGYDELRRCFHVKVFGTDNDKIRGIVKGDVSLLRQQKMMVLDCAVPFTVHHPAAKRLRLQTLCPGGEHDRSAGQRKAEHRAHGAQSRASSANPSQHTAAPERPAASERPAACESPADGKAHPCAVDRHHR